MNDLGVPKGGLMVSRTGRDSLVRHHKTLTSTWNQRLTHHQFIYNSTVLSTELSTTPRPPLSTPPGRGRSLLRYQYHLPRFAKGCFWGRRSVKVYLGAWKGGRDGPRTGTPCPESLGPSDNHGRHPFPPSSKYYHHR